MVMHRLNIVYTSRYIVARLVLYMLIDSMGQVYLLRISIYNTRYVGYVDETLFLLNVNESISERTSIVI